MNCLRFQILQSLPLSNFCAIWYNYLFNCFVIDIHGNLFKKPEIYSTGVQQLIGT